MMIGQTPRITSSFIEQRQPPKMPPVGQVLADRRFSALSNVVVFTPYAIYLARGQKPPNWLIVASLAYLAVSFFEDMRYLIQGESSLQSEAASIEAELGAFPPRSQVQHGHANGYGYPIPPQVAPTSFPQAMRYRVNR